MNDDATTTTTAEEADTEVLPVADQAPVSETPATEKPHLSRGIDLIGKYEGSGFKDPPYIVRRADGQVIQLAPLLYLIAELADGERTNEEIAAAVSEAIERGVSADNVRQLIEKRLRPLGVIAPADGSEPELQKADPLLALRLRAARVPERVVNANTKVFKPLFFPPVVLAVLAGLGALDVWLFAYHGIAQSLRKVLYSPALLMMMLGLVILSAAFHECGHATACSYGGARPGVMGAGLYIVWPAFYTDVTDAYRLGKGGRLRTDLGGVYFNVVFMLATAGVYALTGYEPLLLVIPFMHLEILHQFLPFIRATANARGGIHGRRRGARVRLVARRRLPPDPARRARNVPGCGAAVPPAPPPSADSAESTHREDPDSTDDARAADHDDDPR